MHAGTMRGASLLLGLLAGLASCGRRPQSVENGAAAPKSATSPEAAPQNARFAGMVTLGGDLTRATSGALFVSARRKGQRLPTFSRKYEWQDPAWSVQDGRRELRFALTNADNMGGFGAPVGAEMEVEARYSPSGFIDPKPGSEEEGTVRSSVSASLGDRNLAIRLPPSPGK